MLTKTIKESLPELAEDLQQKLAAKNVSHMGDLVLDGIPKDAGINETETALLKEKFFQADLKLNLLQSIIDEYTQLYPKDEKTPAGSHVDRIKKYFGLKDPK